MRTIVIQGHNRKGWDTETCYNMDDIKAFLRSPHHGNIHAYIDGCIEKHFLVPEGLGVRYQYNRIEQELYDDEVI
jgi:hypothetical protein